MATIKLEEDLFGGLSDSDDEQTAQSSVNVLQDLALSCSSGDDGSDPSEEQPWQNGVAQRAVKREPSDESYVHPKVVFTLSSGDEESSGSTAEVETCDTDIEQKFIPSKRAYEDNQLQETPKRPKQTDSLRAMDTLESSSVESLESFENGLKEMSSSSSWLTMNIKQEALDESYEQPAPSQNQPLFDPSIVKLEKITPPEPQPQPKVKIARPVKKPQSESSTAPLLNPFMFLSEPTDSGTTKESSSMEKSEEIRKMKDTILLANFSKEQLERYEVYRRSTFKKSAMKKIITEATGTVPSERLLLTMRSLTKMFVGDIVEEAADLREASGQTHEPIKPEHIKQAFSSLIKQGKLWPPYGHRN